MRKYFNINGICSPERHYMVNIEDRLQQVKQLIAHGDYFVINRAPIWQNYDIECSFQEDSRRIHGVFY